MRSRLADPADLPVLILIHRSPSAPDLPHYDIHAPPGAAEPVLCTLCSMKSIKAPYRYCLSWSALICPKFSGDAKFVRLLGQAADIVTNDFTQGFIDHRDISLAPKVVPELRLDH
jgi:hypothetical protein